MIWHIQMNKRLFFLQKKCQTLYDKIDVNNRESVLGSVIQATGTDEFEDGLRKGVLQEDSWCPYSGHSTLEYDMVRPWRPALTQM